MYKLKAETCSSTTITGSIFITGLIDGQEGRDVAIVDVYWPFYKQRQAMVQSLKSRLKINPTWEQYIVHEGKMKVPTIYSEPIKSLYGTMNYAELFYDNLCHALIKYLRFELILMTHKWLTNT